MGRTLPTECEHGKVMDPGDFGDIAEHCPECEDRASRRAHVVIEWGRGSDIGDATVVMMVFAAVDHLVAQLKVVGVTKPVAEARTHVGDGVRFDG